MHAGALGLRESCEEGKGGRFGTLGDTALSENVRDVLGGSARTDKEDLGDVPVRASGGQETEHLEFARCQASGVAHRRH